MSKPRDLFDHYKQPHIICPHCGHQMDDDEMSGNQYREGDDGDDLWALAPKEGRTRVACPACDQQFHVQGGYKPTYTAAATEHELDLL